MERLCVFSVTGLTLRVDGAPAITRQANQLVAGGGVALPGWCVKQLHGDGPGGVSAREVGVGASRRQTVEGLIGIGSARGFLQGQRSTVHYNSNIMMA